MCDKRLLFVEVAILNLPLVPGVPAEAVWPRFPVKSPSRTATALGCFTANVIRTPPPGAAPLEATRMKKRRPFIGRDSLLPLPFPSLDSVVECSIVIGSLDYFRLFEAGLRP